MVEVTQKWIGLQKTITIATLNDIVCDKNKYKCLNLTQKQTYKTCKNIKPF